MKRRIALLLIVCLLMLAVPLHAFADDTLYSQGYFLYRIEDGGITIYRYVGDDEEAVIVPNMIANYPVSKIAAGAFDNCPQVKTIYLPKRESLRISCLILAETAKRIPKPFRNGRSKRRRKKDAEV